MKQRPYQREAQDGNDKFPGVFRAWKEGAKSCLLVAPTGTGKTILMAYIIRRIFPKRTMILAHRQELIWQAREKIQKVAGLTVDVEMGEYKATMAAGLFHPRASVIVSTVQTHVAGGDGAGRIGKFDPNDFGLLIIDEAHHATSSSYRRIIDYYKSNEKLVILGVTATPDRADEEALGQMFDVVAFDYEISDAIHDGWLVPIDQEFISIDSLDYSKIRTTAGDLNGSDLSAVMEAEKPLYGVADATLDRIGDKRGIGFASSVNHAQMLSNIFNRHKLGMSACVSAKTDKDERKKIVQDFANGKIQWLWNCGVFTEGFDDAGVEIISMARPTKSRSLYAQMVGRSTRPHGSINHRLNELPAAALRRQLIARSCKPSCFIMDFVGNAGKHKLITCADILGGNYSDSAIHMATEAVRRSGSKMRISEQLDIADEELEKARLRRLEEEARKMRLIPKATYKVQKVDPFDILQIKPVVARGWDEGKVLTEKQRAVLKKASYDPESMDYARGKQLVTILIDRWANHKCSIKQAAVLKKFGCNTDMSFELASRTLDAIAKNGWRKPAVLPTEAPMQSDNDTGDAPAKPAIEDDDIPF